MTLPLVIRPAARAEFDEATDWYERRQAGLGDEFAVAVRRIIQQIASDPYRHPAGYAGARGVQVPEFRSYCVYYRINLTEVEILSVFHASRDPKVLRRRI